MEAGGSQLYNSVEKKHRPDHKVRRGRKASAQQVKLSKNEKAIYQVEERICK